MPPLFYGSVRCNGHYCEVTALGDIDGDPTTDLEFAEYLIFRHPSGNGVCTAVNAPGILVPVQ